jgi:hypothetical protein
MVDAIGLLVIGIIWIGFGVYALFWPRSALRTADWPLTLLRSWAMRLFGVAILAGGAWILVLSLERFHR